MAFYQNHQFSKYGQMRIYEPKNHLNRRLINDTEFLPSSIKVDRGVVSGVVTIDSTVLEDVENWEVASVSVMIDGESQSFGADTVRQDDGSIEVVFGDPDEHLDFGQASIVLNRKYGNGHYAPQELTLEMRINRQMAKTLKEAGKPGYNAAINIAEWRALGQEAYETGEDKYKYANETSFPAEFKAGPVVNECLISIENIPDGCVPIAEGVDTVIWKADLPTLVNSKLNSMFATGPYSIEWYGEMPNLLNANGLFYNCSGLKVFKAEMPPNLYDANDMFSKCTGLSEWTVDLPAGLADTFAMFRECSGLKTFTGELPANLRTAENMFYMCTGLTSWTVELPKTLQETKGMFAGCSSLESWDIELPEGLVNTESMFRGCYAMTEWHVDFPSSLVDASSMFLGCTGLTSFSGDLSHVTNGYQMFSGCTSLEKVDCGQHGLKSLSYGSFMFYECRLDYRSVEMIVLTLYDFFNNPDGKSHGIAIGYDSSKMDLEQEARLNDLVVKKGWTISWGRN